MNKVTRTFVSTACAVAASALLVGSLSFPVWKMRMDAPQYQGDEALKVAVYPGKLTGDLDEIQHIQQYVGIKVPSKLPQLQWLPAVITASAVVVLIAAFLPSVIRRRTLIATSVGLCIALGAAAGMAQWQMYKIGHERTRSPLARVQSFTTPLLGDLKFANFHIKSRLGWGSFLIGSALLLQLAGARLSSPKRNSGLPPRPVVINPHHSFQKTISIDAAVLGKRAGKVDAKVGLTTYEI
jgi:copper chaperone NosL